MLSAILNIIALIFLVTVSLALEVWATRKLLVHAANNKYTEEQITLGSYTILFISGLALGLVGGRLLDFIWVLALIAWHIYTFVFQSNTELDYWLPRTSLWLVAFILGWMTNPALVVCATTCVPLYKLIVQTILGGI